MTALVLAVLRAYQRWLSPALPRRCRFLPTCSEYAVTAISTRGLVRGAWLSLRRLVRCQPFCAGGWDPVPDSLPAARTERVPS